MYQSPSSFFSKTLTMADRVITELHPPPSPNPDLSTDFDPLPIPPLDPLFFSDSNLNALPESFVSDLGLDGDIDFDFTFDDLCFPSDTDDFLSGDFLCDDVLVTGLVDASNDVVIQEPADRSSDGSKNSNSPISSANSVDRKPDVRVLDCSSPQSGNCNGSGDPCLKVARVLNLPEVSGDHSSSSVRDLKLRASDQLFPRSQNSGEGSSSNSKILNSESPEPECGVSNHECSGPASSQGSGDFGSGSEAMNSPSQESGNCELDASSNFVLDQKIKLEKMGKTGMPKRKIEHEDANTESRSSKFRRSSMTMDDSSNGGNREEDKKKARLMRNRESAQLSRQRKKHYVEELEDKLRIMHSTIHDLNGKISYFMAENATLRQQMSGGAMCPPPHPGMYPHPPMAPMGYPWVPAPYMVKQQGSQVPLVPIPRLKTQQPAPAPKAKKPEKAKPEKEKPEKESKKTEGSKTKKLASVSFLSLLFFMLLVGSKSPSVSDYVGNKHRGRVLTANDHSNGSDYIMGTKQFNGEFNFDKRKHCERACSKGEELEIEHKERGSQPLPRSDRIGHSGNSSDPLVASLYVPRNDKLVKIDGNLIIHSVLASEKAMESRKASGSKHSEQTGLAVAANLAPALTYSDVGRHNERISRLYRNPTERQRALTSGSADPYKENVRSADGKLQQWFREGLAGPMLSSGMCTEVFHFDVSPASAPGAIIPASSVANRSTGHQQNATHLYKGKHRRFLHGLHVPFNGSTLNITEEHVRRNSQKDGIEGNKSLSSMVVSVLVDPREAGDGGDGVMGPKSLSRIFVVVLMDSVKYVTYSCMLPRKGSGPHLVTT